MHESVIQIVNKYDEALNIVDSNKYRLSIQLSPDGFSFCIFNDVTRKFLSIESVSFGTRNRPSEVCGQLKNFWTTNKWLKLEFKSVCILYESEKTTLIPSTLFEELPKRKPIPPLILY
ncbi:MAG: DUF3822 family protein [Bacteroidales bacterium]